MVIMIVQLTAVAYLFVLLLDYLLPPAALASGNGLVRAIWAIWVI